MKRKRLIAERTLAEIKQLFTDIAHNAQESVDRMRSSRPPPR